VVSPSHAAGVVHVRVTTPAGTSAAGPADRYTYRAPTITSVSPASGPLGGGQTVTVRGTDFTGATAVKFGTKPGTSVVVASATRLTVVSPSHAAGVFDVRVTTPDGTTALVPADQYTYAAAPTITSVSPTSGPGGGGGQTVTVNGTDFTGVTAVKFGTTPGAPVTVLSPTQLTVGSPPHTPGTVAVRVVTNSGTSPSVPADRYTFT
jgi:hypothetical protein